MLPIKEMEHILRKPVESGQAYAHRRKTLAWGIFLALGIALALSLLLLG